MTTNSESNEYYRQRIKAMIDDIENDDYICGIFYYIAVFWQDTEAFRKGLKDADEECDED